MELNKLSNTQLADFITKNKDLIQEMSVEELVDLSNKLNPYSVAIPQSEQKTALISFTNFKADYYRLMKSISLQLFMKQLQQEYADWIASLKLESSEQEQFVKHIKMFSDRFLQYDQDRDLQTSQTKNKESTEQQVDTSFIPPAQDFLTRWQRYEDQNIKTINTIMQDKYHYSTKFQCALQIYDIFEQEDKVQKFIDSNAMSIGVDLIKVPTNKWVIMQESEETLDKIQFVGDDNQLLDQLIHNMKKDAQLGESMLKQRVNTKKKENEQQHGPIPDDLETVIDTNSYKTHKQQRLDLATEIDINDQTIVDTQCPLLINNGGRDILNMKI